MSLIIQHNLMATNAARNMSVAFTSLAGSVRKLSSGLRIATAADDAAGLAIRELMRADIASMNQGIRNVNDAISLIQTADGAAQIIDEKLTRMKELAEQAASGTYNSDQRLIIDSEYQAMASEISRIANATDFNGIHLLNGNLSGENSLHSGSALVSTGPLKVHFGTANDCAEDYYYISIGNITASALGMGTGAATSAQGRSISTQSAAQNALSALTTAIISKDRIRANLGALENRLYAVTNLAIMAENLQAAESRISDVDVALEMTAFVRSQILSNAAVAMLAQANTLPRMALSLLES
ncbi:flagellin [Desulfobaculum xiamenense]|uniref:Flagellin n=1 Tax=Desulfobaculum xiamenense TaxID=995050 RepID=A0A846QPH4_9BACT|nr:flagellin [Desulfobaculum xiamenense]